MIFIEKGIADPWGEVWWLRNADAELCFAPKVGRIVHFARRGGANALWTDAEAAKHPVRGWRNWGGEKLWFWPQNEWRRLSGHYWPPLERAAEETDFRVLEDGLEWRLAFPAKVFGDTWRRITLPERGAAFSLTTRAGATAGGEGQWWSVAQIARAPEVRARRLDGRVPAYTNLGEAPASYAVEEARTNGGGEVLVRFDPREWGKIGLDADELGAATPAGWLTVRAHSKGGVAHAQPTERAQVYESSLVRGAEHESSATPYAELEFVAPRGAEEWTLEWALA